MPQVGLSGQNALVDKNEIKMGFLYYSYGFIGFIVLILVHMLSLSLSLFKSSVNEYFVYFGIVTVAILHVWIHSNYTMSDYGLSGMNFVGFSESHLLID